MLYASSASFGRPAYFTEWLEILYREQVTTSFGQGETGRPLESMLRIYLITARVSPATLPRCSRHVSAMPAPPPNFTPPPPTPEPDLYRHETRRLPSRRHGEARQARRQRLRALVGNSATPRDAFAAREGRWFIYGIDDATGIVATMTPPRILSSCRRYRRYEKTCEATPNAPLRAPDYYRAPIHFASAYRRHSIRRITPRRATSRPASATHQVRPPDVECHALFRPRRHYTSAALLPDDESITDASGSLFERLLFQPYLPRPVGGVERSMPCAFTIFPASIFFTCQRLLLWRYCRALRPHLTPSTPIRDL